jgi:hypothetical protein
MVKKLMVGFLFAFAITSCFAGYSSGGRSGYSGGSRSFSSSKSYSSARSGYSSGRSGYSRSTNTARSYSAPSTSRSYSGSSSNTVIHNNHYSHGGGGGFGGGFFSGMLGGYLGGTLANNHNAPVIVNGGGAPVVAEPMMQGQGMLVNGGYSTQSHNPMSFLLGIIGVIAVLLILFWGLRMIYVTCFRDDHDCNHKRNRW